MVLAAKTSERYYERVKGPPISHVEEHTEKFAAGAVTIGVEFRLLTDELVGAWGKTQDAISNGYMNLNDNGVSIHVFVKAADGDLERLRFDCFQNDPHYHYFPSREIVDIIHIDQTVAGDPLAWSLNCIRTRLPQMLRRAGIEQAAQVVEPDKLDAVLPSVTEAAFRARYGTDRERIRKGAVAMAERATG